MAYDKSQWATWIGTAMSCLSGFATVLAVLRPEERRLLVVLAVIFLLGAMISFREARKARRGTARPRALGEQSIVQQGQGNIAQIGSHNQATIIYRQRLVFKEEDGEYISSALRVYAGHKIRIFLNKATPETTAFGNALAAALSEAGVQVVDVAQVHIFGPIPGGLFFFVSKTNPDAEFAEALARALTARKLTEPPIPAESGDNDILILYVTPHE